MRALSIRQPWAWLIINGLKTLETRGWTTEYRGPLLIHASKGMTRDEYASARGFAADNGVQIPPVDALVRGGIVGECELTGWVYESTDPWFCGPYALRLERAREVPFVPWRGALGFFDVPRDALTLNVVLRGARSEGGEAS